MSKWKVILTTPDLDSSDLRYISRPIRSKWLTMGKLTEKFEQRFAKLIGTRYAVFVNSGTAALHLACRALGLGPGDEVICPALTFVATANAILYVSAKPVFADIKGVDDLNISAEEIEKRITRRTRAIIVVHYAGYPCEMDRIKKLARKYRLYIIEDAAHAIGAWYKRRACGTWGDMGAFSFYPTKNLTTAEGGMVVTNNPALMHKVRLLRSHGVTADTWKRHRQGAIGYDVAELGYNFRPSEINAALGLSQLDKLAQNNRRRARLTAHYRRRLESTPGIVIPFLNNKATPAYHLFPVVLEKSVDRSRLIKRLKQRGIQTSIHYPPVHQFSYYRKLYRNNIQLPNTEYIGRHQLSLPLFPQMKTAQVDYIVRCLEKEIRHSGINRSKRS
jgi:dTDP-4-amino-4,6-dideoxygalactose transaminase